MKILKTNDNHLAIIFNDEELNQIKGLFFQNEIINPIIKKNPYKYLRGNSIEFIKSLYEIYGNNKIFRHDKIIRELERKYYVRDISQLLRNLSNHGYCEIMKDANTKIPSGRIEYFILNW